MKLHETRNLEIDDVVYNTKTFDVMILTAQWSEDAVITSDGVLGTKSLQDSFGALKMSEIEDWQPVNFNDIKSVPPVVYMQILNYRVGNLEEFVHGRLR